MSGRSAYGCLGGVLFLAVGFPGALVILMLLALLLWVLVAGAESIVSNGDVLNMYIWVTAATCWLAPLVAVWRAPQGFLSRLGWFAGALVASNVLVIPMAMTVFQTGCEHGNVDVISAVEVVPLISIAESFAPPGESFEAECQGLAP